MEVVIWAVIIYLIGSFTLGYFAYKTYKVNPENEMNVNFALFGLVGFIWTFSEALYWTFEGSITLIFYHLKYVAIILVPYTTLIVSLSVPVRRKILRYKYTRYLLFIPQLVTCIAMVTNPIHRMMFVYYTYNQGIGIRYTGEWGIFMWLYHVPVSYIYIFISIAVIILGLAQSKLKTEKILGIYLYACILAPIISNAVGITLMINPDPTSLTVSISGAILLHTVSKYRIFSFEFRKEIESGEVQEFLPAKSYVVKDRNVAYRIFKSIATKNPGIIVSHKIPFWIRVNYGIMETPIVWLTETEHPYSVHPERIDFEIMYNLSEFLRERPNGTVLIDGIFYLSLYHSMDKVIQFIKDVGDMCVSRGGTYIVVFPEVEFFDEVQYQSIVSLFEEIVSENTSKDEISEKSVFLIYSNDKERINFAYEIKDKNLFFVSTKNPSRFGIKNGLWLTNTGKGVNIDQFPFQGLEIIQSEIKKGHHIVLEGFEALFSYFNEEEVLKYIKYIADICAKNGLVLILITSEEALSEKSTAFIEDLADEIIIYERE